MEIQWLGNSSFLIKTSYGVRIFIDPFNILNTFDCDIPANIITLSKDINFAKDFISNNVDCKVLISDEVYTDDKIKIKGYATYGDNLLGLKRGKNYVYVYEIDNLKICHLGYIGEMLNDEIIKTLRNMDILFIPIGGSICLNGTAAYKLAGLLSPKYIIPMCYKCSPSDFYLDGPREFLSCSKNILQLNSSSFETSTLPIDNKPLTLLLNSN